tara:strand:+ start:552 stop:956 length:405 start_codon:yes stop_codon:yes gene_type:complete
MVKVKPPHPTKFSEVARKAFLHGSTPSATGVGGVKKVHRFKPGTVALREIKKAQKSVKACIPKAAFDRLVRELVRDNSFGKYRLQPAAVKALREAAEAKLIEIFEDSQLMAIHAKRTTVQAQDMQKVVRIKGGF